MIYAFYKGIPAENPKARLLDKLITQWPKTKGRFSHCELVIQYGYNTPSICWSASIRDSVKPWKWSRFWRIGSVRCKEIDLNSGSWVVIDVCEPKEKALEAIKWFSKREGSHYDYPGLMGFVVWFKTHIKGWWFCSASVARARGMPNPNMYCPNKLYEYLITLESHIVLVE